MRFSCVGIKQNNMLILLVLVKRGLKIHSDALQLQDFPGKCGHWSQSWIPTESKLFLRKRKKIKLYGSKNCLSKLKLSAKWRNIGFLNLQRKSSSACAAPPSQCCQPALVDGDYQDLNLFSSGAPCRAGKSNHPPNFMLKLAKARIGGQEWAL